MESIKARNLFIAVLQPILAPTWKFQLRMKKMWGMVIHMIKCVFENWANCIHLSAVFEWKETRGIKFKHSAWHPTGMAALLQSDHLQYFNGYLDLMSLYCDSNFIYM